MNYGVLFEADKIEEEIKKLEEETNNPNFWDDVDTANKKISELNKNKELFNSINDLKEETNTNLELVDMVEDSELVEIEKNLDELSDKINNVSLFLTLSGEYDNTNCIIDIHPGAGGTESCDWASMLYRMYTRYCEKKGYKVKVLSLEDGDEAGIKSVSFEVDGDYAYGYLKNEKGIHRLVRLSPFDSNHKRHTSFASIDVTPIIEKDLDIEIDPKDLKIDVYRSTGAGGQGVNTTDSAVRITHLPTKTVVTCQNERSQIQNKEEALKVLKNKLLLQKLEEEEEKLNKIKGISKEINFGSQIRSYVMHPYSMVKDHRTNYETSNVDKVLDGDLDKFIEENLKKELKSNK